MPALRHVHELVEQANRRRLTCRGGSGRCPRRRRTRSPRREHIPQLAEPPPDGLLVRRPEHQPPLARQLAQLTQPSVVDQQLGHGRIRAFQPSRRAQVAQLARRCSDRSGQVAAMRAKFGAERKPMSWARRHRIGHRVKAPSILQQPRAGPSGPPLPCSHTRCPRFRCPPSESGRAARAGNGHTS